MQSFLRDLRAGRKYLQAADVTLGKKVGGPHPGYRLPLSPGRGAILGLRCSTQRAWGEGGPASGPTLTPSLRRHRITHLTGGGGVAPTAVLHEGSFWDEEVLIGSCFWRPWWRCWLGRGAWARHGNARSLETGQMGSESLRKILCSIQLTRLRAVSSRRPLWPSMPEGSRQGTRSSSTKREEAASERGRLTTSLHTPVEQSRHRIHCRITTPQVEAAPLRYWLCLSIRTSL